MYNYFEPINSIPLDICTLGKGTIIENPNYAMVNELENFAYTTTLSWWIFVLAGVLALGIAMLTVSWSLALRRGQLRGIRWRL